MRNVHRLLTSLTEAFPPDNGSRHNITLSNDGDELVISVKQGDQWYGVHVRQDELDWDEIAITGAAIEALVHMKRPRYTNDNQTEES